MFWGLILKASKRYSQTVTKSFHLSQAALDLSTCGDTDVQVMLTSEDNTYLLCTLKKNTPQCQLDLNFREGDKISFSSKGAGSVHLTGYLIPEAEDFFDSDEDDGDTANLEALTDKFAAKDKKKDMKKVESDEDDDDDDDEDEDEDDEDDDEGDDDDEEGHEENQGSDSEDAEYESGSEGEEESDVEEVEPPKKKMAKLEKPKQNGIDKTTSKEQKKDKNEKKKNELKKSPNTKTLSGGVIIEDLKVGSGFEAKTGKKVSVYYEGRLRNTNKIFDSSKQGPGFKFALGRGEVISGWDVGVAGMKIGGKRRITCPPNMAYGAKGSPPVIPANATLVFDVELKAVS